MPPNFTLIQLVLMTLCQTWSFNVDNIVQNEWLPIQFYWQCIMMSFLKLGYRWHTVKCWTCFPSGTLICTVKQRFHWIIRCSSRGCCLSHGSAPLCKIWILFFPIARSLSSVPCCWWHRLQVCNRSREFWYTKSLTYRTRCL